MYEFRQAMRHCKKDFNLTHSDLEIIKELVDVLLGPLEITITSRVGKNYSNFRIIHPNYSLNSNRDM